MRNIRKIHPSRSAPFAEIGVAEEPTESSSLPSNGAAIRSASTCLFTFNNSCSFDRRSSITFLMTLLSDAPWN
jgi:hypothetical protein